MLPPGLYEVERLCKTSEAFASIKRSKGFSLPGHLLADYFFLPPAGAGDLLGAPAGAFEGGVLPLFPPAGAGVLLGAGAFVAIVT